MDISIIRVINVLHIYVIASNEKTGIIDVDLIHIISKLLHFYYYMIHYDVVFFYEKSKDYGGKSI